MLIEKKYRVAADLVPDHGVITPNENVAPGTGITHTSSLSISPDEDVAVACVLSLNTFVTPN